MSDSSLQSLCTAVHLRMTFLGASAARLSPLLHHRSPGVHTPEGAGAQEADVRDQGQDVCKRITTGQLSPLAELASESKLAAALEDAGKQGAIGALSERVGS